MPNTAQTEWSRQASKRRRIRDRFINRARRDGLDCAFCSQPINPDAPHLDPGELTIDHIVPLSQGGEPFALSNLAPAHRHCNRQAGDKRAVLPELQPATPDQRGWQLHEDGAVPTAEQPLTDNTGGRTWYDSGQRCYETGRTW